MTEKILFVDDEPNVLQSMKRQLRKRFDVSTAESGEKALQILKENGPFSVIVSDMRMPVMDGVELLSKIKDIYPDTVRMMLTGNADQETAMEAVNKGHIFRFLTKPCPLPTLITSLALAQRQHRLLTAEKQLLQETLKGSVAVLTELLGYSSPIVFGASLRVKEQVTIIAEKMQLPGIWQYEIAAMLAKVGCITMPREMIDKYYSGSELTLDEQQLFESYPEVSAAYIEQIPRLEGVSKIVRHQEHRAVDYDDYIRKEVEEEYILGAQILKVVYDFDLFLYQGMTRRDGLGKLRKKIAVYNPDVVKILTGIAPEKTISEANVPVSGLTIGMMAVEDIYAENGILVLPEGQVITEPLLHGLKTFAQQVGIKEPIRVKISSDDV